MKTALPFEVSEFENLLRKPNSDPTGFAGFFNSGEVWVARVPARLDVLGGIADYSGANVCEAVLGRGMLMALQPRTDRTLRIRSAQAGARSLPVETRIPLDFFTSAARTLLMPQSVILGTTSAVRRTLCGLMSRWMKPCSWA